MKRTAYIAAAFMLAVTMLAGCGSKDEQSHGNMVSSELDGTAYEKDMPYGATVVEFRPESSDVKVMIGFDRRFFGDGGEEPVYNDIYKVSDFFAAISDNDHTLLKSCYYDGYLEYVIKEDSFETVDEYIDSYYDSFVTALGEGFKMDYIDVSDCKDEEDSTAKEYFDFIDSILTEIAGNDIAGKVTSRKLIEVGGYTSYSTENGTYQFVKHLNPNGSNAGLEMCIYCIDGEYYLF